MQATRCLVIASLAAGLFVASGAPVQAQHPVERTDWTVNTLRTEDQPIIPLFDGWYRNPDGTHQLCFGFKNLNTEEVLDIPLGPDNFIEPAEFDGGQPTHFMLSEPTEGYSKHWCVFSVNVPADFGTQWVQPRILGPDDEGIVWWTLRRNGQSFSSPGHLGSASYIVDEPAAFGRKTVAPVVRFVDPPAGPEEWGRNGDLTAGPVRVAVGQPLTLSVSVTTPDGYETGTKWHVGWGKHQGVGDVTFGELGERTIELEKADSLQTTPMPTIATTTATFSEPGDYLLRVQAIDGTGSFEFHCCWTNGYVEVTVTP